jgi:flagellar motor switch protein FliN
MMLANDATRLESRPSTAAAGATTAQILSLSDLNGTQTASTAPAIDVANALTSHASNPLHQVKAKLTVCVGMAELSVGELLGAKEHQVLRLDRTVDQPVDVLVEGQVVARGTLVAVGDHFGVLISELPLSLKL